MAAARSIRPWSAGKIENAAELRALPRARSLRLCGYGSVGIPFVERFDRHQIAVPFKRTAGRLPAGQQSGQRSTKRPPTCKLEPTRARRSSA